MRRGVPLLSLSFSWFVSCDPVSLLLLHVYLPCQPGVTSGPWESSRLAQREAGGKRLDTASRLCRPYLALCSHLHPNVVKHPHQRRPAASPAICRQLQESVEPRVLVVHLRPAWCSERESRQRQPATDSSPSSLRHHRHPCPFPLDTPSCPCPALPSSIGSLSHSRPMQVLDPDGDLPVWRGALHVPPRRR